MKDHSLWDEYMRDPCLQRMRHAEPLTPRPELSICSGALPRNSLSWYPRLEYNGLEFRAFTVEGTKNTRHPYNP